MRVLALVFSSLWAPFVPSILQEIYMGLIVLASFPPYFLPYLLIILSHVSCYISKDFLNNPRAVLVNLSMWRVTACLHTKSNSLPAIQSSTLLETLQQSSFGVDMIFAKISKIVLYPGNFHLQQLDLQTMLSLNGHRCLPGTPVASIQSNSVRRWGETG